MGLYYVVFQEKQDPFESLTHTYITKNPITPATIWEKLHVNKRPSIKRLPRKGARVLF